jgi:hypothetical protein
MIDAINEHLPCAVMHRWFARLAEPLVLRFGAPKPGLTGVPVVARADYRGVVVHW